jgi:hypothetical protein
MSIVIDDPRLEQLAQEFAAAEGTLDMLSV